MSNVWLHLIHLSFSPRSIKQGLSSGNLLTTFEKVIVPDKKCQCSAAEFVKAVPNRSLSRHLLLVPARQQAARNEMNPGHPQMDKRVQQGRRDLALAMLEHQDTLKIN